LPARFFERTIMRKKTRIKWLGEPQKHDYQAARSYLSLTLEPPAAKSIAEALEHAEMAEFAAKDIFRASGLPLLGARNSHVEKDREKILDSEKVSPLLLVRDRDHGRVIVADGYHRLCAVYTFDEDAMIPCKIV
jgi:disulfide oxidoreductase YuzD